MPTEMFGFVVGAGTRRGGVVAAVGPSDGLTALALLWGCAPGIEVLDVRWLSDVDVVTALRGGIPAGLAVQLVLALGRSGETLAERISGPVEIGEVAGLVVRVDARGRGVEVLKDRAGPSPRAIGEGLQGLGEPSPVAALAARGRDWAASVASEIVADVATDDPAPAAESPEARAVVAGAVARALRKDVEAPRSRAGDWTARAVRAAYLAGARDGAEIVGRELSEDDVATLLAERGR